MLAQIARRTQQLRDAACLVGVAVQYLTPIRIPESLATLDADVRLCAWAYHGGPEEEDQV